MSDKKVLELVDSKVAKPLATLINSNDNTYMLPTIDQK
jgi:hypothetical protein